MNCSCHFNLLKAAALALGLCALACSSTNGGAAAALVGGPEGQGCVLEQANEGCHIVPGPPVQQNRMVCTAAATGATPNGYWHLKVTCGANEYCVEQPDPAAGGTAKKISACIAQVANTPDTISGGNDTTSSGGNDTTVSNLDINVSPKAIVACIQAKCASSYAACMAKPACATPLSCVAACNDATCADKCTKVDATTVGAEYMGMLSCAQDQGCIPKVTTNTCGNGTCDTGETVTSCPVDCHMTPASTCGDLACTSTENASSCPLDCDAAVKNQMSCAMSNCASQWSVCAADSACIGALNCLAKCGSAGTTTCFSACMSGIPSGSQSAISSLESCASSKCATGSPVCGNSKCESGETQSSCPVDCGTPSQCGNGVCDAGETGSSCAQDCGNLCGNGVCEIGESCPVDCKAASSCGDGVCAAGEQSTCAKDCTNVGKLGGCAAAAGKGCLGCLCEQCVCTVGNPSSGKAADSYCCTTAWDATCATECTACAGSGCGAN